MPNYAAALNRAQYEAATSPPGHTLVVAGAGSGKTRTIVYRLAWLVEQGIAPETILLLTFTRKAAQEMLGRVEKLLGRPLANLPGGTFHSFAYNALRIYRPDWLGKRSFTLMDASDVNQTIKECKERLKLGKKDTSFPKSQTIASLISKARNKEISLAEVLRQHSSHLLQHSEALEAISHEYVACKRERALMDYDDLLFEFEDLLLTSKTVAQALRSRFTHILVDEYQDTNLVQARIVHLLAQPPYENASSANVMAVGDDAQSIYAFRGASVRNIMDFTKFFPGARVISLEQNYRSTQPILDVANGILANSAEGFRKHLFSKKETGTLPRLIRPLSDASEAEMVCARIQELLATHKPHEIAVLFRAGFHSYALENCLRKQRVAFRKYGGLRFVEAAHIKDILSFARLAINPLDFSAFGRIALMHKGIGPKTMARLHQAIIAREHSECGKAFKRFPAFLEDLELIARLREKKPEQFFESLLEYYRPRLEELYPDDWPARQQGLEEIVHMAHGYESLDLFVADIALDSPEHEDERDAENCITLSTVHSAKGLEWDAVLIIDAVEDRFPSRHAIARPEDFEEERRLFYVACTRARQILDIYAPAAIYSHNGGGQSASPSPFLRELSTSLFKTSVESYGNGQITESSRVQFPVTLKTAAPINEQPLSGSAALIKASDNTLATSAYCRHKFFGRGKIIQRLDDNRVQVNFPGFGLKIILSDYLFPEE